MDFKNEFLNKDKELHTTACVKAMVHTVFAIYRGALSRSWEELFVSTIGAGTILGYDMGIIALNRVVLEAAISDNTELVYGVSGGGAYCQYPNPDSVRPGSASDTSGAWRNKWRYTTNPAAKSLNMALWSGLIMTPAMIISAKADLALAYGAVPDPTPVFFLPVQAIGPAIPIAPIAATVNPMWAAAIVPAMAGPGQQRAVIDTTVRSNRFMQVETGITRVFDLGIYAGIWATNMMATTRFQCPAGLPLNAY
jgi:hypothetical protein